MGGIVDRHRECVGRDSIQVFGALDPEGLPELSALLGGKANSTGIGWERPPLSLRLYADGNLIKWCISSQAFAKELWGTIDRLADGLLGVEDALCKERCSWKLKKDYDNGFTHRRT
jgi:hypothetical protein